MEISDFNKCPICHNLDHSRWRCENCHYSGFVLKDGRPASVVLGETQKWKRRIKREEEKKHD